MDALVAGLQAYTGTNPGIAALGSAFLVAVAVAGVGYALVYPLLSGEARAAKRRKAVGGAVAQRRTHRVSAEVSKRDQVFQSLKELEERQRRSRRPPLAVRLQQAGLGWSKRTFFLVSVATGLTLAIAGLVIHGPLVALGGAVVGGLGLPRWYLSFRKAARLKAFSDEFPNALDIITRGVKSGLPLGDCFRIIAAESRDPVRAEFRGVMETQTLGIPLSEAVLEIYERMPCAEANFFGIVISIQQKAGGNLSEALGNLARVLRDRKKMRGKIKAISSEAKASAMIIGALPLTVMGIVWFVTPSYINLLFNTQSGLAMIGGCAIWMSIGVAVMRKMINFQF